MKVEHTIEYLLRLKGFRHGSFGCMRDHLYSKEKDYESGYVDGLKSLKAYKKKAASLYARTRPGGGHSVS